MKAKRILGSVLIVLGLLFLAFVMWPHTELDETMRIVLALSGGVGAGIVIAAGAMLGFDDVIDRMLS